MDEATVRQHAQAHADALVEGDLRRSGRDLTPEAMAAAGEVMKAMPDALTAAEVTLVEPQGDAYRAVIRYRGTGSQHEVASTWREVDGRPRIVALENL